MFNEKQDILAKERPARQSEGPAVVPIFSRFQFSGPPSSLRIHYLGYFTVQPYGLVFAVVTGLPAVSSARALST